jgi:ubiquinone/menaquinone biosynthesis C-methylase UbiE
MGDMHHGNRYPPSPCPSTANEVIATGDSWKELAQKTQGSKAGPTVHRMIARMNEILPFSQSTGILDNGCGSGAIISHVLDTYGSEIPETARIVASDYSTHMLDALAQTKRSQTSSENNTPWDRVELLNLDAHHLFTIASASLSHITAGHLFFLLDDSRKALAETYRVLSHQGILALSSGSGSQHTTALQNAIEKIRPGTDFRMIREEWSSEANVRNELFVTGFKRIETFSMESEMGYVDHLGFAKTLMIMPVMKNVTVDYSEEEEQRLLQEVVKELRQASPEEPGVCKGTQIVAIARK